MSVVKLINITSFNCLFGKIPGVSVRYFWLWVLDQAVKGNIINNRGNPLRNSFYASLMNQLPSTMLVVAAAYLAPAPGVFPKTSS